jgi:hypothetical protein
VGIQSDNKNWFNSNAVKSKPKCNIVHPDLLSSRSAASKGGVPQSALTVGSADECGGG